MVVMEEVAFMEVVAVSEVMMAELEGLEFCKVGLQIMLTELGEQEVTITSQFLEYNLRIMLDVVVVVVVLAVVSGQH